MSADNGIYILASPVCDEGFFTAGNEYRIAHCQGIENIDCGQGRITKDGIDLGLLYEVLLFENSDVLTTKGDALKEAQRMEDEIFNSDLPILEYGICTIVQNHSFPEITVEEARQKIEEYWEEVLNKKK